MKLNTRGRYAVMAMVDLAMQHGQDAACSTICLQDIATRQDISLAYLEQLFSSLRKAGLVESVRGPGGGYKLARAAGEINIGEIVLAVDESLKVTRCGGKQAAGGSGDNSGNSGGCMPNNSKCATHELWDTLGLHIQDFLRSISVEDVCTGTLPQ